MSNLCVFFREYAREITLIRSVFSPKCSKYRLAAGLCPYPLRELIALPQTSLARLRDPTSKRKEWGKGRGGEICILLIFLVATPLSLQVIFLQINLRYNMKANDEGYKLLMRGVHSYKHYYAYHTPDYKADGVDSS